MSKLLYGVGFTDSPLYKRTEIGSDGKRRRTKEYRLWCHMMDRCYSEYCQDNQPTYKGCTVSSNFKRFHFFAEWCQTQIGFKSEGYHLDKDILGTGKLYSEDCCVFIPARVNTLLLKPATKLSGLPNGVYFCKRNKRYKTQIQIARDNVQRSLGYFETATGAFLVYKREKEKIIKAVAEEYREVVDMRVYEFLLNYEVEEKY